MIFTFAGKIDKEIKKLYSQKINFIDKGYVIHETAIEIIKSSHLLINFNYLKNVFKTYLNNLIKSINYMNYVKKYFIGIIFEICMDAG